VTDSWNEKQLAQFTRIREGFIKTGFSPEDAEEHARRTIEEARIKPRRRTDPENPTKDQLYREAMRYDIAGRSKMDKAQLVRAVEGHRAAHDSR
jgi:hypothetical protein